MEIIGNKYLVDFGMAKAVLHVLDDSRLSFTIIEKDGKPDNTTETVAIKLPELRPSLYLLTWKESNGNTVTQVQTTSRAWYTATGPCRMARSIM